MSKTRLFIYFLCINLAGLVLGHYLMNNGPRTDWYINLNKAPWTPPGWVFGLSWTVIMLCFSLYLSHLFFEQKSRWVIGLFGLHFILNSGWNYVFFNQHQIVLGLFVITLLTLIIFIFFFAFKTLKPVQYALLPYMLWLCIATSLNAYIVCTN